MDQSNRYARLDLREEDLIRNGCHVLVAYIMQPKAGHGFLATAAHFAAESSTGTNVDVATTDDFTRGGGRAGLSRQRGRRPDEDHLSG